MNTTLTFQPSVVHSRSSYRLAYRVALLQYLGFHYSTFRYVCPEQTCPSNTAPSLNCALTTASPAASPALCAILTLPHALILSASNLSLRDHMVDRPCACQCEEPSSGSGNFKHATFCPLPGELRNCTHGHSRTNHATKRDDNSSLLFPPLECPTTRQRAKPNTL